MSTGSSPLSRGPAALPAAYGLRRDGTQDGKPLELAYENAVRPQP
jgi:hypothetical protein